MSMRLIIATGLGITIATPAFAQFSNWRQTGFGQVNGIDGILLRPAPASGLSTTMLSGAFPDGTGGQLRLTTQMESTRIRMQSEAAIWQGLPPIGPVAESTTNLDITFSVATPTLVNVSFGVIDFLSIPGPPLDNLTIELRNVTTNSVLLATAGSLSNVVLAPADYRLRLINSIGSTTADPAVGGTHARDVDAVITVVPSPAGLSIMGVAGLIATRRRR